MVLSFITSSLYVAVLATGVFCHSFAAREMLNPFHDLDFTPESHIAFVYAVLQDARSHHSAQSITRQTRKEAQARCGRRPIVRARRARAGGARNGAPHRNPKDVQERD